MNGATSEPISLNESPREWAQKVIHGNYYPHIDGLRSLAVLPVFLYHLWMGLCPAGFMGVDVFFVISGYLICGGILRNLQAGSFSLASFYFRRIRRIFAAYFAIVVVVLVVGTGLYHWARLIPLAQTALFSGLFSTNLYFWLTMGYFQPAAHDNPLLHLWSLGVEEQFYILVPVLMLALWKLRRTSLVPALLSAFVISFVLCLVLGQMGQSTTVFYILPTRGWELLAGALLAALPPARKSAARSIVALVGLALVILAYWCYSTARTFRDGGTSVEIIVPFLGSLGLSPFPGWVCLPTVAGSLLLLRYGAGGLAGKLLGSRPLVGIGKISYSLYLWHWPVIVFVHYINYEHTGMMDALVIVPVSFLLAYLSWRWVEMPVRITPRLTPRVAFYGTALGCALLLVICAFLIGSDGLRHVLHQRPDGYVSGPRPFILNMEKFVRRPAFRPPPYPAIDAGYFKPIGLPGKAPTFCLLGDSHAEALAPGLDQTALAHHQSGLYISLRLQPYVQENDTSDAQRLLQWVAANPDIHDVYIVGRWMQQYRIRAGLPKLGDKGTVAPVVLDPATAREIADNFSRTARWFVQHGKRVFIFACVPEYDYSPGDIMARSQIIPCKYPIDIASQDYFNRQAPITGALQKLEGEGLLMTVPLYSAFLSGDHTIFMSPGGEPYYQDSDHLTPVGARVATEAIATRLWPDN